MLRKSMLRQIRSSIGRFLAIFAIIALGVGFYVGLRVANKAMMKTAGNYLEEFNFHDFRLVSTIGFDKEAPDAFLDIEHITDVEGSVSTDVLYIRKDGADGTLHVHQLLDNINRLDVKAGRLPQQGDECVLDGKFFSEEMLESYIELSDQNDSDILDTMKYSRYKVVGIVDSPAYVNFERGSTSLGTGSVDGYIYVPAEGFSADYFTEIYITIDSEAEIYTDEYQNDADAVCDELEQLAGEQAEGRYLRIRSEIEEDIADAEKELGEGWKDYDSARTEADTELGDAEQELKDARQLLDDSWANYDSYVEKAQAMGLSKEKAENRFSAVKERLEEAEEAYQQSYDEFAEKRDDTYKELDEALEELNDAQQELDDARQELEELDEPDVFVLDRSTNVGYACLENDTDIVAGISKVFPLFFFLVAALVCITTMTRMVQEQRVHNGVLKALGFSDFSISFQYLFYAGSASVLGCITGFLVGSKYMPMVLWKIYHIMYTIDRPVVLVLDWRLFGYCTALYMLCALGATWLVCRQELNEVAAELIRPKAPTAGKRVLLERIPFIWNRLPFMHKVSVRNILRYKKRMLMMILGIGGCTALLLTGFGIRDSIKNIVDFQYDDIFLFDGDATFLNEPTDEERNEFANKYASAVSEIAYTYQTTMDLTTEYSTSSVNLICYEEPLTEFIDLHTTEGEAVEWPEGNGAVINYRLAKDNHLSVGDTIELHDSEYNTVTVTVTGIFENYIFEYILMPYEAIAGQYEKAEINTALFNVTDGRALHEASAELLGDENVLSVNLNQDMRNRVGNMLKSMDYVVLIVLVCAGALAFIVLYNLTNITINERIREIATLKVLGCYTGETASYVFRENLVLTGIAAAFGIPMGIALLVYVMSQIQIKAMYFPWRLLPVSYVYSVALTFLFAYIVAFFLYFRMDKVDMAESMKAIE